MNVTMSTNRILVLIDYHPLVPFIVRSHQFASRASGFAKHSPDDLGVQLWLPSPALETQQLAQQIGSDIPYNFTQFGPPRTKNFAGKNVTLTFLFRNWVKKQLQKLSQSTQPIVYLRTLKLADALIPQLHKMGIPYIFETHEIFHRSGRHSGKIRLMENRVYKNAAIVVSISKSLSEDLKTTFGVKNTVLMPSGHNGSLTDVPEYVPEAPPRFLYIGSLHRWKGLEPFLISTRDLEIPTDIVGDGGGLVRLKQFVEDNNLKHVVLHGQKQPDELKPFYAEGTICILPLSEAEIAQRYTSPLKLFEYTSAGRPVMIGKAPTITSITGAREAVYLVEGNWKADAESLLSNSAERERLSIAARRFADNYTWSKIAKNLLNHSDFQSLICNGSS